ncbi:hypothetical protein KT71_000488 [Congregibacter litoralis KT71]|uniref:Uncharacterized protein n=1 Tax=Congregibacter litoralis KT71 TaxID=314285 RepID=V7HVK6_9GAMM|nr:hypothetical protein KT71_000488 [Congregibacter litoralis KT71]
MHTLIATLKSNEGPRQTVETSVERVNRPLHYSASKEKGLSPALALD